MAIFPFCSDEAIPWKDLQILERELWGESPWVPRCPGGLRVPLSNLYLR